MALPAWLEAHTAEAEKFHVAAWRLIDQGKAHNAAAVPRVLEEIKAAAAAESVWTVNGLVFTPAGAVVQSGLTMDLLDWLKKNTDVDVYRLEIGTEGQQLTHLDLIENGQLFRFPDSRSVWMKSGYNHVTATDDWITIDVDEDKMDQKVYLIPGQVKIHPLTPEVTP